MSRRIAKFEKVSWGQFFKDMKDTFPIMEEKAIKEIYDRIQLPKRATTGSAGYDFFSTIPYTLEPGETVKIPTGIRCVMEEEWVLMIFPRSGLGFKYRLQLDNTVGIIDTDYAFSDNEGHIFVKITNDSYSYDKVLRLEEGQGVCQGIFLPYGITEDDDTDGIRNGGFGSTGR